MFLVLAIDNHISKTVVEQLKQHYQVVIWAGTMPDEQWIEEALDLGANVFISPDLDISLYLDKYAPDVIWIDVPQKLAKEKQFNFLMEKLKKVK